MLTQQQVQETIKGIIERITALEEEKASRRVRAVERKLQKINARFGNLKTGTRAGIAVAALFLTLVIGLVSMRFFDFQNKLADYTKFEAARGEYDKLLIGQFKRNTAEVINRLFLVVPSEELRTEVQEVKDQQQSLAKLNIPDKDRDFKSTSGIIEALAFLVQKDNRKKGREEAMAKISDVLENFGADPYVESRAIAIQALIDTSKWREDDLKRAIYLDGTNALAFNCLGVMHANEAQAHIEEAKVDDSPEIIKNRLTTVIDLVRKARVEYEICGNLDASMAGAYRRANNLIDSNILLVRTYLDAKQPDGSLDVLGYSSVSSFFREAHATLKKYDSLRPDLLGAMISEAQLLCLEAEYRNAKRMTGADELVQESLLIWLDKTPKFFRGYSYEEAWETFRGDSLNRQIYINGGYELRIQKTIQAFCPSTTIQ